MTLHNNYYYWHTSDKINTLTQLMIGSCQIEHRFLTVAPKFQVPVQEGCTL